MKKTFIFSIFALVALFIFMNGTVFAQGTQVNLPSAGLTPEGTFYFLDRLGENLRQFFTFDPEAKAKLQIEFAGERIAEIKIMIEKKGANAKGLTIAESLLQANVAYAAEIVSEEKTSGKDVTVLAKTLNDEFDARDKLLEQTFKEAKAQLKTQRKEIKTNLLAEARRVGDTTQIAELEAQLKDIDGQIDILGQKKDQLENSLQDEQKNIEKEMDEADQEKEEIEQKEEQEVEEIEEAEEADELEEVDEPEEAGEPQEINEDDKKDSSQNSNSSNQGEQNASKAEDDE